MPCSVEICKIVGSFITPRSVCYRRPCNRLTLRVNRSPFCVHTGWRHVLVTIRPCRHDDPKTGNYVFNSYQCSSSPLVFKAHEPLFVLLPCKWMTTDARDGLDITITHKEDIYDNSAFACWLWNPIYHAAFPIISNPIPAWSRIDELIWYVGCVHVCLGNIVEGQCFCHG